MASLPHVSMDRGVPSFILIQLLIDFETHGGLHGPCSLKALCDLRPQLYGQVGSSRRRAIQNKTHRLKTMTRLAYLELLATHGILPFQPVLQTISTVRGLEYFERPLAPSPTVTTRIDAYGNSTSVTTASRSKVSGDVLRMLLQSIEDNGGRKHFVLRIVCNRRPDVFGPPGSPFRRVIQNKTNHIKSLSNDSYVELLNSVGIVTDQSTVP